MGNQYEQQVPWRRRYRPYIVAFVLAFVMTMLVAPEINEGAGMEPVLKDGQLLLTSKSSYSAKRGQPDLGQVVILQKTLAPEVSEDNIISRVAGLPGDTVEIRNGRFYRNGKVDKTAGRAFSKKDDLKIEVSRDDVFLLCDNSKATTDSRNPKLGTVNMRQIKGNVLFVLWPLSDLGRVK